MRHTEFLIVGAGIAGSSMGAELAAAGARTLVLERETRPGYHSTGRSAALFSAIYGSSAVRALTRASRAVFETPPQGFSATVLHRPRGLLIVASDSEYSTLEHLLSDADMAARLDRLDPARALEHVPILRQQHVRAALYEPGAFDIDVAALHDAYLRKLRSCAGTLLCDCEVRAIRRVDGAWHVRTSQGDISAAILVNAAGAWADSIAALAGVAPLGITPMRRTALLVAPPANLHSMDAWPLVTDLSSTLYFKPEAGKILLSPMDETPSAPCDVQPDELDVAIAVDRFEQMTTHVVDRVAHRWAGLRSFARDHLPVAGFDPASPTFFWLAGQGGFGIQTAPAMAIVASALVRDQQLPPLIRNEGIDEGLLSPARLGATDREATPATSR